MNTLPSEIISIIINYCPKISATMLYFTNKFFQSKINNIHKKNELCDDAAYCGYQPILGWARENGCQWDYSTCAGAAYSGNLEMLKWIRLHGGRWDANTCIGAASCGNLEMLKWARENKCPWDGHACARAASSGHLDIL